MIKRQEKLRFQVGGTVNPRTGVYIVRPSDDELFQLLERGDYANVLCARQMGKSSLLIRTKARLAEMGYATAAIDVAGYLGSPGDADEWYQGLLDEIARQLCLNVNVTAWWESSRAITRNQRLIQFFRDEIAARASKHIVIFLDEIDSTLKLPYTDDFFVAIRAMYNDRAWEALYDRITFCLVGVASPNELIKDRRTTPYNIGRTIELKDFDPQRDDLSPLFRAMANDPATGKAIVQSALRWTGGHPYLTLRLCDQLATSGEILPELVDKVIKGEFASLDQLHSDIHFQQVLRFLDERVEDKLAALTLYRRIRKGEQVRDQTTPAHIALRLAGIVKRDLRGWLIVRNPIYTRIFTDEWVAKVLETAIHPFNSLLERLHPDRDLAGEEYERLHSKLVKYFLWNASRFPEELADKTFDRVAFRLKEGEVIKDIVKYIQGVARYILLEDFKEREKESANIAQLSVFKEDVEEKRHSDRLHRIMEECLKNLSAEDQELISQYYVEDKKSRLDRHDELAERRGIPLNAMRIRVYRIRQRLKHCIQQGLNEEQG
jgi:DNA-directed RNA polymerase specialized sigma24 family protein